ncbi:unnamed protein product [Euphydryas editha]|uniref:Uncharacterized protein n=1 Tax=Euphydryas editha TaxID=104508 RepID=A0AAU9TU38_EUPED|nr:unnamed protein product [Euphydryas editha]
MECFRTTFTLNNNIHSVGCRIVRTEEVVAAVQESIEEDPNQSIPFKIQLVQELKPNDYRMRRQFGEWAEAQIDIDIEFLLKILFCDEAHFWLNGYVNKQNCHIWSEDYLQSIVETPLHRALWAGGVVSSHVFKNVDGQNITVNGERYRDMIRIFFVPQLTGNNLADM